MSPLQECDVRKATPRPNSFDDVVLTEFGDFVAQTAAIMFEAGFSFEEISDALDPRNLRPHLPIDDNSERIVFVQCEQCTARIPEKESACWNCGVSFNECPPRRLK